MIKEKISNNPVLFFILTIIVLIILQSIPADTKIGPFKLKSFDLFYDVKPDSLLTK